jgi:putative membrane protein
VGFRGGASAPPARPSARPSAIIGGSAEPSLALAGSSQLREDVVVELVIKILVNAAALWAAVQLIPQIKFIGQEWWKLLAVALIFALVNSYLKPIVKALSFPISLLTLGLIGFVINAAMLLLTALLSDQFKLGFKIGTFPPSINADTIIGAILGAIVISIVSTLLSIALSPRKLL